VSYNSVYSAVFQIKWNKKEKQKYLRSEVFMAVKIYCALLDCDIK